MHDLRILSGGNPYPVLADIRQVTFLSAVSRRYFRELDFLKECVGAAAIVVNSPASRLVGSIFLGFLRPPYPIQLFGTIDNARLWCEQYRT